MSEIGQSIETGNGLMRNGADISETQTTGMTTNRKISLAGFLPIKLILTLNTPLKE